MNDPNTERFTGVSPIYDKYRPGYPKAILDILSAEISFSVKDIVADIGSGTGKLSSLFLDNGNIVYGVEPNDKMRSEAERKFQTDRKFISMKGSAEKTGLDEKSVNLVAAGQSFHWFNQSLAKIEFKRVMQPGGHVVLIWNTRRPEGSPLNAGFEDICIHYSNGYHGSGSLGLDEKTIRSFFSADFVYRSIKFSQVLDFDGLLGRYMTASYSLKREDPLFPEVVERMQDIFKKYSRDNRVELLYDTEIYIGKP